MKKAKKDTNVVQLKRSQTGLDFSLKGGKEHGIPIIVSDIESKGAADGLLNLGDEILSVNGRSLLGLTHEEAVDTLKKAGQLVSLCIRPNYGYRDAFSNSANERLPIKPAAFMEEDLTQELQARLKQTLPSGWSCKVDHKSGRPYYENHWTETTTWTDPTSLQPVDCYRFDWKKLPPGWEGLSTPQGDIYYVNHDNQTTSWDHPQGLRQMKQLDILKSTVEKLHVKIKELEGNLALKRNALLAMNTKLETLHEASAKEQSEIVEEIMIMNEEVEYCEVTVNVLRVKIDGLIDICKKAVFEEVGEMSARDNSAQLSIGLVKLAAACFALEGEIHQCVKEIDENIKRPNSTTPLNYLLQMPPLRSKEQEDEKEKFIHVLPDKLTAKTNCELRLELLLLEERKKQLAKLCQILLPLSSKSKHTTKKSTQVLDHIMSIDMSCLHRTNLLQPEFQGKIDTWIQSIEQ